MLRSVPSGLSGGYDQKTPELFLRSVCYQLTSVGKGWWNHAGLKFSVSVNGATVPCLVSDCGTNAHWAK